MTTIELSKDKHAEAPNIVRIIRNTTGILVFAPKGDPFAPIKFLFPGFLGISLSSQLENITGIIAIDEKGGTNGNGKGIY